jgi:hypothetical protein
MIMKKKPIMKKKMRIIMMIIRLKKRNEKKIFDYHRSLINFTRLCTKKDP